MLFPVLHKWTYRALGIFQWVGGVAVIALTGSLRADPDSVRARVHWLGESIAVLREWAWVSALLIILIGCAQLARNQLGPPWIRAAIHKLLDQYRDKVFERQFSKDANERIDHHRVTLFRHAAWYWRPLKWPLTRRLIPTERSGHLAQRTTACFNTPDDGDRVEGIAGLAWTRKHPVAQFGLPAITRESSSPELADYARRTGVSAPWVQKQLKRGKSLPRSLCGFTVEVKAVPWGVIVLDSQNPEAISPEQLDVYRTYGMLLIPLLERI